MSPLEYNNTSLLAGGDALWVDGIGYIAQYHCYCDMLYSHGIIYYARDYFVAEVARLHAADQDTSIHTTHLASLNSKICEYEQHAYNKIND